VSIFRDLIRAIENNNADKPGALNQDAQFKHLEFIQAAIARMANNSFLFKGWAITIATALAGFAAVDTRRALLVIALVTTVLFWGLDGYYLWLERGFVKLHNEVALKRNDQIDFKMAVDKSWAFGRWLKTCFRWHLIMFYGAILGVEVVAIFVIKGGK
jgi:hypothetical protein